MVSIKKGGGGASESFKESDKKGRLGEKYAIKFMTKRLGYKFLHQTEGKNSDYDLKFFKSKKVFFENVEIVENFEFSVYPMNKSFFKTVEVKTDMYDLANFDNHNISFEVMQYPSYGRFSKESGLSVTKADIWFNYFPGLEEVWIIGVNKLRQLIVDLDDDCKAYYAEKGGSKSNPTDSWLVGRKIAFEHFFVFNSKGKKEIKTNIKELTFK